MFALTGVPNKILTFKSKELNMNVIKSTNLQYTEGSSDKVYKISINATNDPALFTVDFAYGRRGNTLTVGSKTPAPVPYEKAMVIYGKLMNEKMSKGYTETSGGKPFTATPELEIKISGYTPQLLNEVDISEIENLVNNINWCAQEKYDGVRRLLIKKGNSVTGTNRKGLNIPLEVTIIHSVLQSNPTEDFVLDGEAIGDKVVIFDIVDPTLTLKERLDKLNKSFVFDNNYLILAPTAYGSSEKAELYNKLRIDNAEGIVFKDLNSLYKPGRPNSGGDQLKLKFVDSATCIVGNINTNKRSVELFCKNGQVLVSVGNVTIYPNQIIPSIGQIVEVRYLYYFPGGSLFQPVLLGTRDDMDENDCQLGKLKIKRDESVNIQ